MSSWQLEKVWQPWYVSFLYAALPSLFIGLSLLGRRQEKVWGHRGGVGKHRRLPQFHPPHNAGPSREGNVLLTFSDSSWSFNLTASLPSTDESVPAGEALPVPEVGERGGAGESTGSARPDQGDRAQVWPDMALEHARPRPLQVRRVQGTCRLTEAVGVGPRPCRAFSVL